MSYTDRLPNYEQMERLIAAIGGGGTGGGIGLAVEGAPTAIDDGTLLYTSNEAGSEEYVDEGLADGVYYYMLITETEDGTMVPFIASVSVGNFEPIPLTHLIYELVSAEESENGINEIMIKNLNLPEYGEGGEDFSDFDYIYIPDAYTVDGIEYRVHLTGNDY